MGRPLGQHFLRDPLILDRIVAALDPTPDDVVLEIGAGDGTLTSRLAPRVGRVVAVEKDRRLADALRETAAGDRVTVAPGDALALDWHAALASHGQRGTFKIVGNIPYAITSPLIEKALVPPAPAVIVFLVQKEVAERLAARPATSAYGALSVGVQATCRVERLFAVRAGAFSPPPRVDSAVVRLIPRATPLVAPDRGADFRGFVTALFSHRRKQLRRSLRHVLHVSAVQAERLLADVQVAPETRAERLDPETFVRLFAKALR